MTTVKKAVSKNGKGARYLTAEDILGCDDLPKESMWIPEWNGNIWVRGMTALERDSYEESLIDKRTNKQNLQNARAKILVKAVISEDGERLFTEGQLGELGKKSAKPVDRIWDKVRNLSGMTAKSQEEIEEDFGKAPIESVPTG